MDPQYVSKVQQWVECDNILMKHKDAIKETQERKKSLEDDIIQYIEANKYDKLTINISDGNIKFGKRNVTQPLSMRLIRSVLEKYAQEKTTIDVDDIFHYIQESLEVKQKVIMTRELK